MRVARSTVLLTLLLVLPMALAGCIGGEDAPGEDIDETTADVSSAEVGAWPRALPAEITGLSHLTQVEDVEAGGGLWLEGDLAYVSGQNSGFYILNVSTPTQPELVSAMKDQYSRDVDLLHYEDGRTVAVLAASGTGMVFVDVTDPARPEKLATVLGGTGGNVHNIAVVPGTHIVYNSRSLDTPGVDIVDASDPATPEVLGAFNDVTCHDVTFWTEGQRAYCAGVRETQIWDISDPEAPAIVTRIHNPLINIHHWAKVTQNGSLLLIGDEFAGSTDAAAGCLAAEQHPLGMGTLSDPVGAVWFYDISEETLPTPLGYVSAELPTEDTPPTPCTAHFGELVPERSLLILGWRAAGTYLIDYSDPSQPEVLERTGETGDVWEARVHNGYVFTGDTSRGMDVLTFE